MSRDEGEDRPLADGVGVDSRYGNERNYKWVVPTSIESSFAPWEPGLELV